VSFRIEERSVKLSEQQCLSSDVTHKFDILLEIQRATSDFNSQEISNIALKKSIFVDFCENNKSKCSGSIRN
jgi:hypothetical protein